jgi:5-(carboxyamino)imidazole ribonucleotide synthase
MIPFKNELAVIVCRNPSGEIRTYPVVEFHPEANQVEYVICPARIDDAAEKQELSPYTFLKNSIM